MTEVELTVTLLALLPVIKLEERPPPDKCKVMIGTLSGILMIRTNQIMIRVGGGFTTLEEHIRQVGPFECIKIFKKMRGNEELYEQPNSFKNAVLFFMRKLRPPETIIKQYESTDDDNQMGLFEESIVYLKQKQDDAAKNFTVAQADRRMSRIGSSGPLSP